MPKQQTHVKIVRQWCVSLGVLTAISISREEAEMKLAAYIPMLLSDFTDAAFTTGSLNHVAKACVKGFPTYPELHNHLSGWWREHRPLPPLLARPAAAPPPEPRVPPTEEEIAYVHERVREIVAAMHSPFSEPRDEAPPRRASYLTPEQLDQVNPLPHGRKRVEERYQ